MSQFAYLDLIFADTLISDINVSKQLKRDLSADFIIDKKDHVMARFTRTEIFLEYLKQSEENEFKLFPSLLFSDLGQTHFIPQILDRYLKGKKYTLSKFDIADEYQQTKLK